MSVLLPVRNAVGTLGAALDSTRTQTLVDHEVIVVDDGSIDGTAHLVRAHARRDPRIRLLSSPALGLVPALNLGLEACQAPLVARMDADDVMHRDRLRCQSLAFERWPKCAVVGTRVQLFPAEQVTGGMREYLRWQNNCLSPRDLASDIYLEAPFTHPSVAFRRDTVTALGGYRDGVFPEDYDLWLRINAAGLEMRKLSATLLSWRLHPKSLSRRDGRYSRSAFDALRAKYLSVDPRLTSGRDVVVWGAGRRTRARFKHAASAGVRPCAWIDVNPRKLGNRLEGAPVVPPAWLRFRSQRPLVLVYVANHGVRDKVGQYLDEIGYVRGVDYLHVG
jgi:cellulose synthase/poly-beta-1,6-N-acetylglucosamine synthase-like glycosyltransferase